MTVLKSPLGVPSPCCHFVYHVTDAFDVAKY